MEPFSKHIFLFPFKLKLYGEAQESQKFIETLISTEKWKKNTSKNNSNVLYNEKKFFHDFANPVIFSEEETHDEIWNNRDSEISKLEYLTPGFEYKIGIYKKEKENIPESPLNKKPKNENTKPVFKKVEISLNLKKVTLDISKNIGVFAFHLDYYPFRNDKNNSELSDNVLLINQYGRRIFPPFKDLRSKDFGKMEFLGEGNPRYPNSLEGAKMREMPDFIKIVDNNKYEQKEDDRTVEEDWTFDKKPSKCISYIPKHILKLLFLKNDSAKEFYQTEINETVLGIDLIPVLDDRMFVLCWMGAEQLTPEFKEKKLNRTSEQKKYGNILSGICERQLGDYEAGGLHRNSDNYKYLAGNRSIDGYGYVTNDYWYQFLFVDGLTKTCQNELLQQKLALTHTYDRWVESYSLIGVTRYSFIMMTAPLEVLKQPDINAAFLPENFATIYFRMVSLVLLQRSMILDFSDEISKINFKSREKEKNEKNTKTEDKTFVVVRELYEDYRNFINKIYFREVTAQEQGIELYDMLQEHLRVEKQAKELEKEFDELHRLMNLLNEEKKKENEKEMKVLEENKQDKLKYFAMLLSSVAILSLILNLLKSKEFSDLPNFDSYNSKVTFSNDSVFLLLFIFVFAILLTHLIRVMYPNKEGDSQKISLGWKINAGLSVLFGFFYFLIARQFPIVTISYFVLGALCILPLIFHIINCIKNRKSKKQTVNQNKP